MAITEKQRHDLFKKLEETLGPDASTLMDMLPPVGWADVATKADLAAFKLETRQEFAAVRADIERLDRRFDGLGDVFATKAELHQELRGQTRTFVAWTVTSQATLAGVVAMLVSLS
jgi:hypothetical protein